MISEWLHRFGVKENGSRRGDEARREWLSKTVGAVQQQEPGVWV